MNSPRSELSGEREYVAQLDHAINDVYVLAAEESGRVREEAKGFEASFYDDPTYNDIVSRELGIQADYLEEHIVDYLELVTQRSKYVEGLSPVMASLFQPVPDMEYLRTLKPDYRNVPIDDTDPRFSEPVVSLRDYGVACRAYYSRPNGATGDPVEGVKPDVFVRQSVAETLQKLNESLAHPDITRFFGGEIELAVDEGWRDPRLQKYLHDVVIPGLIRAELHDRAEWSDAKDGDEAFEAAIIAERDKKIARPPTSREDSPSPHAAGPAVDLALRYKQSTRDIVPNVNIPIGRKSAQMTDRTDPDYFEHRFPASSEDMEAMQNRRALYAIMAGRAVVETGLQVNPTEFWHWSRGDQLGSLVEGSPKAYYGWPEGIFDDETDHFS